MAYCVFIPGIMGSKLLQGINVRFPVFKREPMANLALKNGDQPLSASELFDILKYPIYKTIDTYLKRKFGSQR